MVSNVESKCQQPVAGPGRCKREVPLLRPGSAHCEPLDVRAWQCTSRRFRVILKLKRLRRGFGAQRKVYLNRAQIRIKKPCLALLRPTVSIYCIYLPIYLSVYLQFFLFLRINISILNIQIHIYNYMTIYIDIVDLYIHICIYT